MKRLFVVLFTIVLLTVPASICLANGGGTCGSATVIPGIPYSDNGTLDGDNDCSNPVPTPYNDVFYTFTATSSSRYIFRLQVFSPSHSVSIRIMSGACCAGGTTVAAETNLVDPTCDAGYTTYTFANLIAGTQYWVHVGDNSAASRSSAYHLDIMDPTCPTAESTALHDTSFNAEIISCNDSIYGDSAYSGHPDWYRFTLPGGAGDNFKVTISEYARSFGHCNSGNYPGCFENPLDAYFVLYCLTENSHVGAMIGFGEDSICSADARSTFCLRGGPTYAIKVENHGGGVIGTWPYILAVECAPTSDACPTIPEACGPSHVLCPDIVPSTEVVLEPDNPIPGAQHDSACVFFRADLGDTSVPIIVLVFNGTNHPHLVAAPGCCGTGGGVPVSAIHLDTTAIHFVSTPTPRFVGAFVWVPHTEAGCAGCIRLEFVEPVELASFTATAGDGQVTLNWRTASERRSDRFEIFRDGAIMAQKEASNLPSGASYSWMDNLVVNGVTYSYTLWAVDLGGTREELRTISATPRAAPVEIREYALAQNYPNPFNPSTLITFDLKDAGTASLKVYNLIGQQVAELVSGEQTSGRHTVMFSGDKLPSGVYIYRLSVNGFVSEKKMLLMK
jgi:hypothetical protein